MAKFEAVDHRVATEDATGAFAEASSHAGEAPEQQMLFASE